MKKNFINHFPLYKCDEYTQGTHLSSSADSFSRLAILNEVGLAVTQLLDLQEILNFTVDILVNKLGIAECMIYLWNEDEDRYQIKHFYGISDGLTQKIEERRLSGFDLVQKIADNCKAIFISKLGDDHRFEIVIREKYFDYSYIGFPLISRKMVIGVIELISPAVENRDEDDLSFFKTLGRSIGIAIDNALLVNQIQKQKNEAISLFHLSTKISSSLILKEVLEAVAEAAKTLLNTDIGLVGLHQESCEDVKIWSGYGENASKFEGLLIKIDENSPGRSLVDGNVFIGHLDQCDDPHLHSINTLELDQISSYLAVPLHLGTIFVGVIEVMNQKPREFRNSDIQLIKQLGYQIIVSIENARLHQQLRYGATLEEQNRLARELHDHLAQAMGYIKIKAIMTNELLTKKDFSKAQEHLKELINTTSVLYTDIREAIFNLRNTDSDKGNFLVVLQSYLTEYEQNYGLDIRLNIDDKTTIEFSSEVANQLLRIIQEALSNVRRHACAQRVWIKCWQDGGEINISIEDDGTGFNPAGIMEGEGSKQRYGLQIMQERVNYIKGKFSIDSQPGQGTRVLIQVPSIYID
ncbi:MAG: GAF domain-containing protein [Anaerolineaceae bacterium]|nr:GAF domain-containing protein [Anaerolineaceae bacterium]